MARTKVITIGAQAASNWIPLDPRGTASYDINCVISNGASLTYKVEATNDDVQAASFVPASAAVYDTAITGKTASFHANLTAIPRAIRLNCGTYSSGNVTMTVVPGPRA